MIVSLGSLLENDTRLFQKIGIDITRGQLSSVSEVDSNEFTETGGVVVTDSFSITLKNSVNNEKYY